MAMLNNQRVYYLVGGAITILKNMSSPMGRMTSHILWKNNVTTNQLYIIGDYPNISQYIPIY